MDFTRDVSEKLEPKRDTSKVEPINGGEFLSVGISQESFFGSKF